MPAPTPAALAAFAALAAATAGCGAAADPRAAWLQGTLTDDNRDLLYRDPSLVQGKYAKMALGPYPFFRGTALQWMRDLSDPGPVPLIARFMTPEAGQVLLVGDPHPENLGSFLPADGELTVDYNDFDAARYGPYPADLWRLATGFELLARDLGLDDARRAEVRAAPAEGYFDAVTQGAPGPRVAPRAGFGAVVDDLMRRAQRDGQAQEELTDYTELVEGARRLRLGVLEPELAPGVIGEALQPASPAERRLVAQVFAQYAATVHPGPLVTQASLQIKDVARHLGAGVSSYALLRYYVLLEGPTASPEDDWLMEAKELRDPAPFPNLALPTPRSFETNAERVVFAQRALQATPDGDPLLGYGAAGALSLKVRHRTKYQKGADVLRIAEDLAAGDLTPDDVVAFARVAGALLGRGHAQANLLSGRPAGPALQAALGQERAAFVAEAADVAARYTDRVEADYQLFLDLLDASGPLLGARTGAAP